MSGSKDWHKGHTLNIIGVTIIIGHRCCRLEHRASLEFEYRASPV